MKLEINLDQISVNDYEDTIGSIIKQEMDAAVRYEVRRIVKEQQKELAAKIAAAVRETIKGLSAKNIQAISYKMLNG